MADISAWFKPSPRPIVTVFLHFRSDSEQDRSCGNRVARVNPRAG